MHNNMESPYNSPYTPNTIKSLNQRRSMFSTIQPSCLTINQSIKRQSLPLTTRIVNVNDDSNVYSDDDDEVESKENAENQENYFGIYSNVCILIFK